MLSERQQVKLVTTFRTLSGFDRQLIGLRALCSEYADQYGFEQNYLETLMSAGMKTPQGKPLTHDLYKTLTQSYIRMGFSSRRAELIIPNELRHVLLTSLAQEESAWIYSMLDRLIDPQIPDYSEPFHYQGYVFENSTQIKTRLMKAIYANESNYFTANVNNPIYASKLLTYIETIFGEVVFSKEWLLSREQSIQWFICIALLGHYYCEKGISLNHDVVMNHFKQGDWSQVDYDLLHYYGGIICLSLAQIEHAVLHCQTIQATESGYYLALKASIAFLNNQPGIVIPLFQKALTAFRKQYDNRAYYFDTFVGVFHQLSLAYIDNNPAQLGTYIDQFKKYAQAPYVLPMKSIYSLLPLVTLIEQGELQGAKTFLFARKKSVSEDLSSSLCLALYHLIYFMSDKNYLIENIELIYSHTQLFMQHQDIFAAQILYELLKKTPTHATEAESFLATSPIRLRFLELIHLKEAWEYSFQALEGLLIEGADTSNGSAKTITKRLLWLIEPEYLTVDVVEQRLNKSGWSFGKPVNLSKLIHYDQFDQFDYLTEQDKAVIKAMRVETSRWGNEYYFDEHSIFLALVGHLNVAHLKNRNVAIELIAGEPELHIEENEQGYHLSLSHALDEAGVILEPESMNRYRVIDFSPSFVSIAQILTQEGLTIPVHAKEKILKVIQHAKRDIQIHVGIKDLLPEVAGDPTLCIQLLPTKEGIRATLWVRPLASQGSYYKAGQGKDCVMTIMMEQGIEKRVRIVRDLALEKQNQDYFLRECSRLALHEIELGEYETDNPEETLEVLSAIQEYAASSHYQTHPVNIEWPQGETFKIKQRVLAGHFALNIASGSNWFEYDGKVTLDDGEVLSMQVLLDSMNQQSYGRFVRLANGEFIELTSQLKKQLHVLSAISDGNKINALGAQILSDIVVDAEHITFDAGWQAHLEKIKSMRTYTPEVPSTLQANLRDYQIEGFQYLSRLSQWGIGACLADDMGLGKTIQTIALLLERAKEGAQLVIAPTSVGFNWIEELNKFAPTLNVYNLQIDERASLIEKVGPWDIVICSYGLLQHNHQLLAGKHWETIVLDEAQAIKNANTQRWKAVMALNGKSRIALSGTPIENHLGELWSIFSFINPGLLGTIKSFQTKYATPIETKQIPDRVHALKALVSPYILRRIKSDVLSELPPKTEQIIHVEQSEEEALFYEALRRGAEERVTHFLSENNRIAVLAEISKLRQACCDSSLVDSALSIENSKLNLFIETLKNIIENGHKALVFSQYVSFLQIVKRRLEAEAMVYQYLDGSTSPTNRKKAVNAFQSGEGDVFLLSLKAGGSGLNLTAADYVIHLDPWWNPAVEDQASDRAHRIGQERPVTIYRFVMQNTIEEKIISLHEHKRNLANELLSGHNVSGKLSNDDLMNLIYSAPLPHID